ncbi:MAG TPA: hypothetical protein VKY89_24655 [Thermoanaerobaculia bacterium]|jgi:hypothetical protein|nr:hypothetical protein [Thermoanaerobaculia bacterium]
MSDRRPAALLVGFCVLFAAAQVFAAIPQLHACAQLEAAGLRAGAGGGAAAGWRESLRGKPVSEEECPICRIANLALVMQGSPPASAPSLRIAQIVPTPPQRCRWLRLDSPCGRAPPRS